MPLASSPGRRRIRRGCLLAVIGLALTGCGTRLPDSAFVQAGQQQVAAGSGGLESSGQPVAGQTAQGTSGVAGAQSGGTAGTYTHTGGTAGHTVQATAGSSGSAGGGGGTSGAGPAANTASDVGITPGSITIGNITSVSGSLGPDAFGVTLNGLRAYISSINDQGGINGRKINLKFCDDGEDGTVFLSCAQQLVEQAKVFALIGNNSDASSSGAHYEYQQGVPDVGFPLNNGYNKYPNMFSIYGDSYPRDGQQTGANGVLYSQTGIYRYFKQQVGVSKAAMFYYVIPVSKQAGCGEESGLTAEGISVVYEGGGGNGGCSSAGENPASPDFDIDVVNMQSKGVDNVWDTLDVSANLRLCQAMDRHNFTVKAKVSTIEVWDQSVGSTFSSPCRNSIYIAGSSDPYSDQSNPMVAKFLADFNKYEAGHTMAQWSVEGWAAGWEFTQNVASMGANVTRKGFMAWLNSLNRYTMNGLFTPFDYRVKNYSVPPTNGDCNVVVQWQDSANTFVTREPPGAYCPITPYSSTPAGDDGS